MADLLGKAIRPKDPVRDRALTEAFHRWLSKLPMPMTPQSRMRCYGFVQLDERFFTPRRRTR